MEFILNPSVVFTVIISGGLLFPHREKGLPISVSWKYNAPQENISTQKIKFPSAVKDDIIILTVQFMTE